jgi:hypothetical protein
MSAVDSTNDLDPALIDYEDIYDSVLSDEYVYYMLDGKEVKFVVFLEPGFEGADEDYFYGVVLEDPSRDSNKDWIAEIDVFGEGKAEYVLKNEANFNEGDVVEFYLNSKGEAVLVDNHNTGGNVDTFVNTAFNADYDDDYLDLNGRIYKVDTNAVVYELDEEGDDIEKSISRTRVDRYENIRYAVDDEVIVAMAVWNGPSTPTTPTGITFVYNEGDNKMAVSGLTYDPAGDNEYIVRVTGDAIDGAVYSSKEVVGSGHTGPLLLNLADGIPANGIYTVELINTSDYDKVLASDRMFLPKTN